MGFYISSTPPGQVSDTIFSLFLLPFLKQPLKREDGTEAKAEKNVMPIEGGGEITPLGASPSSPFDY